MFKIAISIAVLVLVSCFIYYQSQRPKLASLDDVNALFYRQTGFHRINRMQVKEAVEIDKKNLVGSGIDRFWIDFFAPWRIKEPNEIFPHGNVSNDIEVLNANISFLSGDLEISVRKLDLNHMYIICEGTEEGTLLYNYTRKSK